MRRSDCGSLVTAILRGIHRFFSGWPRSNGGHDCVDDIRPAPRAHSGAQQMSRSASYLGCFLFALVFAGGAETRAADFDSRVTAAIDNWAQDTHIVVTKSVKTALLTDARAAVDD